MASSGLIPCFRIEGAIRLDPKEIDQLALEANSRRQFALDGCVRLNGWL